MVHRYFGDGIYSENGKSTFAEFLDDTYGLPVLHLDTVHWLAGWRRRTFEDERTIVSRFLNEQDGRVVDGNYQKICFMERIPQLSRVGHHAIRAHRPSQAHPFPKDREQAHNTRRHYTGKQREDRPGFFRWVLVEWRDGHNRKIYQSIGDDFVNRVVTRKIKKELDRCKQSIEPWHPRLTRDSVAPLSATSRCAVLSVSFFLSRLRC